MCETKDRNLEEIREKAIREIEEYSHKGNEFLGLLFITAGMSLSKVDNIWIFTGAGFGVSLISGYFVSKYFPSTIRELRKKRKGCLLSQEEERLLKCLEKNYFGIEAFIKRNYVILFSWMFFWLIFLFRIKEIIEINF